MMIMIVAMIMAIISDCNNDKAYYINDFTFISHFVRN